MKVEFLDNTAVGLNGYQLHISYSELVKADKNEEEFYSFAFATNAFFRFFGLDRFINKIEYEYIKKHLKSNGAVIITVNEDYYSREVYPVVYISIDNVPREIDIQEAYREEGNDAN